MTQLTEILTINIMDTTTLEGLISVQAALKGRSRPIHKIYVEYNRRDYDIGKLEKLARTHNVPLMRIREYELERMTDGNTHGGVVAVVGDRIYTPLAQLCAEPNSFVVMLEGVEDPFNFGQAVRALYACGAAGLVVRPRNWMSAATTVARASAGASELIPTAIADDALSAAEALGQLGLKLAVMAEEDNAIDLPKADLRGPLFVVVGGEKRGVAKKLVERANVLLQIPYARQFRHSLGTTSAAAVLGYEVMRQRMTQ